MAGKVSFFGTANTQSFGINRNREVVGVTREVLAGEIREGIYCSGSDVSEISLGFYSYHPLSGINNNSLSAGEADSMGAYWKVGEGYSHIRQLAPGDIAAIHGLNDLSYLVGE